MCTISGPGEVDGLRNVDLIPSGPHEKPKAMRLADELLAQMSRATDKAYGSSYSKAPFDSIRMGVVATTGVGFVHPSI